MVLLLHDERAIKTCKTQRTPAHSLTRNWQRLAAAAGRRPKTITEDVSETSDLAIEMFHFPIAASFEFNEIMASRKLEAPSLFLSRRSAAAFLFLFLPDDCVAV